MQTTRIQWVDINKVITNPKNPRKDPSYKTAEMQRILKTKGFEEAIVAYKTGPFYCIISGHRRWWAAKQIGVKEVPIYLVDEPKNALEELERLGSIQGNQTDWSSYEWMIHTMNLYEHGIRVEELALKLGESLSTVKKRISVGRFYPKTEIETQLSTNTYSLNMLDILRLWCIRVKKLYPEVYKDLPETYIRQSMLKKLDNKCLNSDLLKGDYLITAGYTKVVEFITDPTFKLTDFVREVNLSQEFEKCFNLQVNVTKIKKASKNVNLISYFRKSDAKKIYDELESLETQLSNLMGKLKS
ncbi:ParB/RepB/Spo0J family partition protein [Psychrobacillus antarcticus]|uniref:ParB/RepB/Spo0J family partition protein n=1 Tax=Psychrobacillus antarcticus TaxID=2879115 RepID=UPI00240848C2|nr:ParB/RepB/Spo0J family partition protein [Psychrobacillus antarcticus]